MTLSTERSISKMSECARVLSNFHLTEKRLSLTPRDEWQLVVNQGYFLSTPVFGTPAPTGAASETANFEKWRCLLHNIRTFFQKKYSPQPSPQEEGHVLEGSPALQRETVVSPPVFTPDCLGFPQGSQPSAHASGKPRLALSRVHAGIRSSILMGLDAPSAKSRNRRTGFRNCPMASIPSTATG